MKLIHLKKRYFCIRLTYQINGSAKNENRAQTILLK